MEVAPRPKNRRYVFHFFIEQKEAAKKTREQKRKEKMEQERKLEEHWAVYRWTTEYKEKNMSYWECKRKSENKKDRKS